MNGESRPLRGYGLALLAALLWAFSGNLGKVVMDGEVQALTLAQGRTLVAACGLGLYVWARGDLRFRLASDTWLWIFVFGTFLGLVQFSYFAAIERIQVAPAILLEYLAPALVVAFAWGFQGRRPSPGTVAAVITALLGCALVVRAFDPDFLELSLPGIGFGLMAALTFAAYILVGEHLQEEVPVAKRLFLGFGVALLVLLLLQPPWQLPAAVWQPRAVAGIVVVGLFGTLAPFSAFMAALRYLDAGRATTVSTMEPVFAGVIAFFWLGERLGPIQIFGGLLVVAAVVVLQREERSRPDDPTLAVFDPETTERSD